LTAIDFTESLLASPGTINYFDEDGNFLIAPKTAYHIAQKRAWEKRIGWEVRQTDDRPEQWPNTPTSGSLGATEH